MDTRLLEYFVTVADELSVTRAAGRLSAAQSTVSAGLKSLERELGVVLFVRTTKQVQLSSAGAVLLPTAREIVDGVQAFRSLAVESGAGLRGRVRVGTFAALPFFNLPDVVARFRARYPQVDIQLLASRAGTTGLVDDLLRARLDIAFTALPVPESLQVWPLAQYPFVALVQKGHRLARRSSVSLAELGPLDWVDVLPGYGNRVQIERSLSRLGIHRHVTAELAELPSVPSYVASGLGVAIVPDVIDTSACARLSISDQLPPWTLSLAGRNGALRQPQVKALVTAIRRSAGR